MAIAYKVFGAALVRWQVPNGSLIDIGYTIDGVSLLFNEFEKDIHSDDHGGSVGPPGDVLLQGATADIEVNLEKYDWTNLKIVLGHKNAFGTPPVPGTLLFGNSVYGRLLIATAADPWNFPYAHLTGGSSRAVVGTQDTAFLLKFRALRNTPNGILFNQTNT